MRAALETSRHSYERFCHNPFVADVDRASLAGLPKLTTVLDVATGTGAMIEHLEELGKIDSSSRAVGIDINRSDLTLARSKFGNARNILFIEADGHELPLAENSVDAVTVCNSIHLMDPVIVLGESYRILKRNGFLVVTSAYEKTHALPEGTARTWGTIVSFARRSELLKDFADIPNPIDLRRHTADDYGQIAQAAGFRDLTIEYHTVKLDRQAVQAICDYEGFAAGALPGVPVELTTKALVDAVDPTFDRFKIDVIPRTWMFLYAQKP